MPTLTAPNATWNRSGAAMAPPALRDLFFRSHKQATVAFAIFDGGADAVYAPDGPDLPRWVPEPLLEGGRHERSQRDRFGSGQACVPVHGAEASGWAVLRKRLRCSQVLEFFGRQPRCVVAMEACGGAHFWGRELARLGHDVRLIPPAYVKPFVKRQKSDVADAEASLARRSSSPRCGLWLGRARTARPRR
jgi:hypothetical protein